MPYGQLPFQEVARLERMARDLLLRGFPVTFPPPAHEPLPLLRHNRNWTASSHDEGMPPRMRAWCFSESRGHGELMALMAVPYTTAAKLPLNRFQPQRRSTSSYCRIRRCSYAVGHHNNISNWMRIWILSTLIPWNMLESYMYLENLGHLADQRMYKLKSSRRNEIMRMKCIFRVTVVPTRIRTGNRLLHVLSED